MTAWQDSVVIVINPTRRTASSASRIRRRPPRDILPGCTKPPAGARKKSLFLVLFCILIRLVFVKLGCAKQCGDEDDKVNRFESGQ